MRGPGAITTHESCSAMAAANPDELYGFSSRAPLASSQGRRPRLALRRSYNDPLRARFLHSPTLTFPRRRTSSHSVEWALGGLHLSTDEGQVRGVLAPCERLGFVQRMDYRVPLVPMGSAHLYSLTPKPFSSWNWLGHQAPYRRYIT